MTTGNSVEIQMECETCGTLCYVSGNEYTPVHFDALSVCADGGKVIAQAECMEYEEVGWLVTHNVYGSVSFHTEESETQDLDSNYTVETVFVFPLDEKSIDKIKTDRLMHRLSATQTAPQDYLRGFEAGRISGMKECSKAECAPRAAVPENVMLALDRMCTPLDESMLCWATAAADAHCMKLIRDYVLSAPRADADTAGAVYREVGVWEPNGSKFKTYAAENLNGKAMYVKESGK